MVFCTGETLYTAKRIRDGQRAWRAAGGQQRGSVWGHGAYVAPDWSADWLHREAVAYRDLRSKALHGAATGILTLSPNALRRSRRSSAIARTCSARSRGNLQWRAGEVLS